LDLLKDIDYFTLHRSFGFIEVANSSRMSSSLNLQRLFVRSTRAAGRWTSQLGASSALQHARGFVSATLPLLEKKSVKVPSMGDSITEVSPGLYCFGVFEKIRYCSLICSLTQHCVSFTLQGTIVEWVAQLGEAVKDGEVIAMVETDKVTIDIKAEMDGVITQHFGAV
jgi:biotin carboxyl carrier protein